MPVQVVADGLDIAFRALCQIESLTEAAHTTQQGYQKHAHGGVPQCPDGLLLQRFPADHILHPKGQGGGLLAKDRVHRDLDDLGRQRVEGHAQTGTHQTDDEILPAMPQISGDQAGFLPSGQFKIGFHKGNTPFGRVQTIKKHPLMCSEGAKQTEGWQVMPQLRCTKWPLSDCL